MENPRRASQKNNTTQPVFTPTHADRGGTASRHSFLTDTFPWLVVFALALYARLTPYANVFVGGEVRFDSNDSYLHVRRILLTVNDFPRVANFDNYIGFPQGMAINWPPLWDFTVAALAMVFGLGHPSEQIVLRVSAVFPVLIGLLTLIPLAYLAKNVFGPRAVWPTLMIAAVSPALFEPTFLGNIDHHGGVIFFLVSVLALATWAVGEGGLALASRRSYIRFTVLLGLTLAGSLLTWLGSVFFLGFTCISFLAISLASKGRQQNTVANVGAAYLLACFIILPFALTNPEFTFSYLSLFQVVFLAGCGISLLTVAYAVGVYRPQPQTAFLVAAALTVPLALAAWTLLPNLRDVFITGFIKMFALYPWGQANLEWTPLVLRSTGIDFQPADDIYGKSFFVLPIAVLLTIIWLREHGRFTPAVWIFFAWSAVAFALGIQVIVFSQFLGSAVAIFLGVGALAAWDLFSPQFGSIGRAFQSKALPPAIPFVVAMALLTGSGLAEGYLPQSTSDFHELLTWLRSNTPPTAGYYGGAQEPEYGILSNWTMGDAIAAVGHRPVVADGNSETNVQGFVLLYTIMESQDENAVVNLMEENRIRYVVIGQMSSYYDGDLRLAGPPDGSSITGKVPEVRYIGDLPRDLFTNLVFTRLYYFQQNLVRPLNHFRLLHIGTDDGSPVYVYELVKGAQVLGKSEPNRVITAAIPIRTTGNRGTTIRYETTSRADGTFELVLPYATSGRMGDTMAAAAYTISDGQTALPLQISEKQVVNGESVEVSFSKPS